MIDIDRETSNNTAAQTAIDRYVSREFRIVDSAFIVFDKLKITEHQIQ